MERFMGISLDEQLQSEVIQEEWSEGHDSSRSSTELDT